MTIASPRDDSPALPRDTPALQAVVTRAREGDAAAFGELVDLHRRVVFRTALAALGDREDAEDVTQEVFVLAWRKLRGFRGDASFRTWLLSIAWRRALDRRRSRRRWLGLAPAAASASFDPLAVAEADGPDPERQAVASDLARRVQRHIAALSPKLRDTLLLASSGEYSYEEIARVLDVPLGTVKWRVSEARRLVHARLREDDHRARGLRS